MKVLITGAAGFIGGNFAYHLNNNFADYSLTILDKLTYSGNYKTIAPLVDSGACRFVKGDIADTERMNALFTEEKFDIVVHFAAESHVDRSIHGASEFVRTNVMGTQSLLDAARCIPNVRFIHVSTDEVYGSLGPTGKFFETTPLDPTSPYAASKASSDLMALAAAKTHGLDVVVTRCTNNYGPYQFPEKLIPLFVTNAYEDKELPLYGDGSNVRSWLHVEDHCDAIVRVMLKGRKGEVYNIGGSEEWELTNLEVAHKILDILGKPHSLLKKVSDRLAHDKRYAIDHGKISKELDWYPKKDFTSGLEETVKWYLDNQEWWKEIKSGDYTSFYELNYGTRAAV